MTTDQNSSLTQALRPGRSGYALLMEAKTHWDRMDRFRRDRLRNKRYTYGDQWKDMIEVDGRRMTEEQYIRSQGNVPLKNNLIRRLVSSVLGVWRRRPLRPVCRASREGSLTEAAVMTRLLLHNMEVNRADELYARTMEEFLVSGLAVHRKSYGVRLGQSGCWTDCVDVAGFFIDSNMRDIRGWDCTAVGQVHDIPLRELMEVFATDSATCSALAEIFGATHSRERLSGAGEAFGFPPLDNCDFLHTSDSSRCRVIELWRRETRRRYRCHDRATGTLFRIEASDRRAVVDRENSRRLADARRRGCHPAAVPLIECRWILDSVWRYYFLSPLGHILREGDSPCPGGGHPYVFRAYPFIDGEIHSFVSDVIDQQRYTNRLITMYDHIMRSSAKGLLLFPENCLPDGMTIEEIADQWSRYNGIVLYKARAGGAEPRQITGSASNLGITELLSLQLKFFEDISGVSSALQGRLGFAGQSASLYSQQTRNATTTLLDLIASFASFVRESAAMDVRNIVRFYSPARIAEITGTIPAGDFSSVTFEVDLGSDEEKDAV